MELYSNVFANVEYWKKIGEEVPAAAHRDRHGALHPASAEQHRAARGRGSTIVRAPPCGPGPGYVERKGFALKPKFIFIDGRTGYRHALADGQRGNPLQRQPGHPGAVLVFRADGPDPAELS
jgi:hypothetical protein